ncbi:hypothetical protein B0H14DRAFT_3139482 [Mycena olivaceomarginata]|nr:hypothetical protein B0H14DRAFT_3139482 [Mycena olivaceomarginata]
MLWLHAVPVTGTAVVSTGPERERVFSGPVDPSTAVFDGNGRQKCSERAHETGRHREGAPSVGLETSGAFTKTGQPSRDPEPFAKDDEEDDEEEGHGRRRRERRRHVAGGNTTSR